MPCKALRKHLHPVPLLKVPSQLLLKLSMSLPRYGSDRSARIGAINPVMKSEVEWADVESWWSVWASRLSARTAKDPGETQRAAKRPLYSCWIQRHVLVCGRVAAATASKAAGEARRVELWRDPLCDRDYGASKCHSDLIQTETSQDYHATRGGVIALYG
jgi:hypothetical protein